MRVGAEEYLHVLNWVLLRLAEPLETNSEREAMDASLLAQLKDIAACL